MLLIKNAELHAYLGKTQIADVYCHHGLISKISHHLELAPGDQLIHANGAALLPGLHDHHLHLLALAAIKNSIHCGPPHVTSPEELRQALQQAKSHGWIRGIQYHESVAGDLDRLELDQLIRDRPVRIQHRSGIMWILNSCAIEQLQLEKENVDGLERNSHGELTGRLFRLDSWLRHKIGTHDTPDIEAVSQQLSRFGITGVTDTSAHNDIHTLKIFESAIQKNQLRQRLVLMGNESLPASHHPMIQRGALKILLDEFQLPDIDLLREKIQLVHEQHRAVAFHCITATQLVFALSVLQEAGVIYGDRIEHASVCPDELISLIKQTGVSIVTQPGLLKSRGNQYQTAIEKKQHALLYRCKSFLQHNIPLALSSDAPYGDLNPWQNIQAAVDRRNQQGYLFGESEKLTPEEALIGYLRHPLNLSNHRKIAVGEAADFCLLENNWENTRKNIGDTQVDATIIGGRLITA